jgi:hypothetical protein
VTRKQREAQEDALAEQARRAHTAPNHLPAVPETQVFVRGQALRVDLALLRRQRDWLIENDPARGIGGTAEITGLATFLDCILDAAGPRPSADENIEDAPRVRPLPDTGLESDALLD